MDEPTICARDRRKSHTRVLIVDDCKDTAAMMQLLLSMEGYAAHKAHDGVEAIEAAKAQRPHVVLLDLTLPYMDGTAVARTLRGIPDLSDCHIVAVSGYGKESIPHPSPFDRHLTKPVDPEKLITLLAEITREASSRHRAAHSGPVLRVMRPQTGVGLNCAP
jgi:CheY-like chemotaxis protein